MLITYQITFGSSNKALDQGVLKASKISNPDVLGRNSNSVYIKSTNSITQEDANNKKQLK